MIAGVVHLNSKNKSIHLAQEFRLHHHYNDNSGVNDIALVRIRGEFHLNDPSGRIKRICLPDPLFVLKGDVIAAGWGITIDRLQPKVLQTISLPVIKDFECERKYDNIRPGKFCAGIYYDQDVCHVSEEQTKVY